jgi:hypothetical protein
MARNPLSPFGFGGVGERGAGSDPFLSLHREMNRLFDGFRQGSRHRSWPTRAWAGIGPPLTKGADEDAVLGLWVGSRDGATRAHRPGLSPVPLPRLWQAVQ